MSNRYKPPRSGKRSLAVALLSALVAVGGLFAMLGDPSVVVRSTVNAPDTAERHTKATLDYAIPSPMPKLPEVVPQKSRPAATPLRSIGSGIFKCEDANRAVTYSQFPCDDFKVVDTKPTSAGFGEAWQTTVKHR